MPSFTNKAGDVASEADYKAALKAASFYFDNEPELGSEEARLFEELIQFIENYESQHFPLT